jgi:hypothetical protein
MLRESLMKIDLNFDTADLTFLTCATGKYLNFIDPFIFFAKRSNPNCHIEIFVSDPNLMKKYPNVTFNSLPNGKADTLRYIVEPTNKTKYTYITDIDILYTELVCPFHLIYMKNEFTFSNIVRTNKTNRMSGLHFVLTDQWYFDTKQARSEANVNGQDENELYKIVKKTYPQINLSSGLGSRPVHGIHCSFGRAIYKVPGWEITAQKLAYFDDALKESPKFCEWFYTNVANKILKNQDI